MTCDCQALRIGLHYKSSITDSRKRSNTSSGRSSSSSRRIQHPSVYFLILHYGSFSVFSRTSLLDMLDMELSSPMIYKAFFFAVFLFGFKNASHKGDLMSFPILQFLA
jgi:hypothetical protein